MNRKPDIEEDRITFKAVLKNGVPFIPAKMVNQAERIAKKHGRKIVDAGGDFEHTWFFVKPQFTKDGP